MVYHGSGNANDVLLGVHRHVKVQIVSCIGCTGPSLIVEIDTIRGKKGILKQINKKNESSHKHP
jgi:hypothetical protein